LGCANGGIAGIVLADIVPGKSIVATQKLTLEPLQFAALL